MSDQIQYDAMFKKLAKFHKEIAALHKEIAESFMVPEPEPVKIWRVEGVAYRTEEGAADALVKIWASWQKHSPDMRLVQNSSIALAHELRLGIVHTIDPQGHLKGLPFDTLVLAFDALKCQRNIQL